MTEDEKPEEMNTETEAEEKPEHQTEHDSEDDSKEKEHDSKSKASASLKGKPQHFWHWFMGHKLVSIPAAVVVFLVLFFVVPLTRYSALGLFLKQDFSVVVLDSQTGKPVSSALISLEGKTANTDGKGQATLQVPVGNGELKITKAYYKSLAQTVLVPVRKPSSPLSVKLEATGRAVPLTVLNGINGKPVLGATITADKAQAKTDDKGQAILVVPVGKDEVSATVAAEGYNTGEATLKVGAEDEHANALKLTPAGKIYFLSDKSGKLDVVKSDLDGKNRQTVLAGTGKESKGETVLLATRDWKYLALLSKRDGGDNAKLFLINSADDSLTTMDEGDATFTLVGWEGHRFLYLVNRYKMQQWEPKKEALKSYDASAKKLTTIDQTAAEGSTFYDYLRESFGQVYALGGNVIYVKNWEGGSSTWYSTILDKQVTLNSIAPDGGDKKVIKSFSASSGTQASALTLQTRPHEFGEVYLQWQDQYFEYTDGKVKSLSDITADSFYSYDYTTYLLSPSSNQTFWSLVRDGKEILQVGDAVSENEKTVATLDTDYQTYGWYSNDYLLVSKKGSELFIMPVAGVDKAEQLSKITDYYKPFYSYYGYGGGYGGL